MVLGERAQFLVDNLDLPAATGVDDARFEYFQLALWSDDSTFRIENKSRQIAWSWALAADFTADAILNKRDGIFISINLEEAKEKIRYAHAIYDNLRLGGLPKVIGDSQLTLEFDNGARLRSLPSRPARGRARSNIGLDEFAHAQRDKEIYSGSLPVISKGGRLRSGSSPLGASGVFWEVSTESLRKYPGYNRRSTPWWEVYSFCVNVREARKLAPAMLTAHRVDLFGNDRIKAIYANMPEEDFQQEYECSFVDESTAWITWEEIKAVQENGLLYSAGRGTGKALDNVKDAIADLVNAVKAGRVETSFAAGVDIGRTRNTTEIFLVGQSTTRTYPLRLLLTLDGVDFDSQYDVLVEVLTKLPVSKMMIDKNGLGMNLAENAQKRFPSKAFGVDFTNTSKKQWATDVKTIIQQRKTILPNRRDLAYQIHSIKRMVTASNNLVFDTDSNERHHADMFWALALALSATDSTPTNIALPSHTKQSTWKI